jgi:serine protease Do
MRRIVLSFILGSAALALVVACTGKDRAGAEPGGVKASAIYQEASTAAPAPAAEVPVGASLAPLIERLKSAVVNINTTTQVRSPHPRGFGRGEPFERFFGLPAPEGPDGGPGGGLRGQGLGSGFILNAQGLVLTNHHVVKDATDIRVRLSDNTEYVAKVIGKDAATDVALLQLTSPPKNLPTVVLGDSDQLRQGDFVVAMGSPFGLRETATLGIVSAKHRAGVSQGTSSYDDFLQTDAAINPGNSGGPLFNLRGEVVGINTAIVSPQIGSGIGFAVPINLAKSLLPQLQAKGKVVRGYLGVSVSDLTPDLVKAFGLAPGTKGALVQQVVPKQPAAKAGVEPGDVVLTVNGKPVDSSGALTRTVALVPPGDKVTLVLLRRGAEKTFSFAVAQRPDELVQAEGGEEGEEPGGEVAKSPKLGLRLQPVTPELARQLKVEGDQGVLVADVTEGGPAERAGVQRGDLLMEVNRRPVTSTAEVSEAIGKLKEGDLALLRVRRGSGSFFIAVPIGGR